MAKKVNGCHPEPGRATRGAQSKDPENAGSHDTDSRSSLQYIGAENVWRGEQVVAAKIISLLSS